MRKTRILFAVSLSFGVHAAFASIISVGAVANSGPGLGPFSKVLALTSPAGTSESGCVSAGIGGITVTGPAACPAGFTGGDEVSITQPISATSLGLTDFNNLQIVLDASEPGGGDQGLTLTNLSLTVWDPATGLILDARYISSPIVIPDVNPGAGNAGFGFQLDSVQAGVVNGLLAAFPDLFIGLSATLDDATGGPERFYIRTVSGPTVVPEPLTYLITGSALAGLTLLVRRKRV